MSVAKPEIDNIEEGIAHLSVRLNEIEREFESIEIEASALLKSWIKEPVPEDKDKVEEIKKNRLKEMARLNSKEEKLEKEYIELRRSKDESNRKLRDLYLDAIKDYIKSNKSKNKMEIEKSVPLERSSLLTGTSMGGVDDTDYGKIFKDWDLKNIEIYREPLKQSTDVCVLRKGRAFGKEVLIKEYVSKPDEGLNVGDSVGLALSAKFKELKTILGHRNLLTPIARIGDKIPVQVVVELVQNQIPSLHDALFVSTYEKITFSFSKKVNIARSIGEAMAWLHEGEGNYSHLRLKPSNILFTREWKIKVADYGLGLPFYYKEQKRNEQYWFDSFQVHFSAPEVLKEKPTKASDIWSFGMLLIALFSEVIPYSSCKNYEEVKKEILGGTLPTIPPNIPKKLSDIISKCLQQDPAARTPFKDMASLNETSTQLIWDEIIIDAAAASNEAITKIWHNSSKEAKRDDYVPWSILKKSFTKCFTETYERCTQFCLGARVEDILTTNKETIFKKNQLLGLLNAFRPFDASSFPALCEELCKKNWFYGLIERNDIEGVMNQAPHDKKPFAVRNSERAEFKFVICYIINPEKGGKMEFEHLALDPTWYEKEGIISFVEEWAKSRGFRSFENPRRNVLDLFNEQLRISLVQNPLRPVSSSGASWGSTSSLGAKIIN